jgi:predicted Ser/Thr protein kinase
VSGYSTFKKKNLIISRRQLDVVLIPYEVATFLQITRGTTRVNMRFMDRR